MKPHKHAAIIKAYAERAQVSETPWDIIQVKSYDGTEWIDVCANPNFASGEYRIKPRTININGFEVPEPALDPLERGKKFFKIDLERDELCDEYIWHGDHFDNHWLSLGVVHLTREAAQLHAKALLSFTKK